MSPICHGSPNFPLLLASVSLSSFSDDGTVFLRAWYINGLDDLLQSLDVGMEIRDNQRA